MKAPTKKRLLETFRDLTPITADLIRHLAHATDDPVRLSGLIHGNEALRATAEYARRCYNDPFDSGMWRTTMALHAIDVLLGTHGVESLGHVSMHDGPPYEYCNAGDPYTTTLIYHRDADALRIGCWGDIAEKMPREED